MDHVFLDIELLNGCSLSSLMLLPCVDQTAEMTDEQITACRPVSHSHTINRPLGRNHADLAYCDPPPHPESETLLLTLAKNHLSLKESCLCAAPVGQINELSIHDRKD